MEKKKIVSVIIIITIVLLIGLISVIVAKKADIFIGGDNNTFDNKTIIKVYESDNDIEVTKENKDNNLLKTYECNNKDCEIIDYNKDSNEVLIKDNNLLIFNHNNEETTTLDITDYEDAKLLYNNLGIKKDNKYALYNKETKTYITEFIYDGIVTKPDNQIVGYTNTSKYNQEDDVYVNNELVTHYNHCVNTDNKDNKLYCGVHVEGKITNEEVDNYIDIVLSQYPDLENKRLFLIKNAMEAVGLPYLWGGGHSTLEDTMNVAEKDWNTKMVYLYSGFKNQVAGQYYPSGLDCAGFVRWAVYVASGLDIYKDHVNVISGRNKDVTLIDHEELLPGDIITDPDHITIYLYKDENGKDISVHASYSHLQVEISNYKRGNTYWRINPWME